MCPEVVLVNTYLIFSKKAAIRSNPPSQSNRLLIMGSPLKLFSCVTDPVTLSLSLSPHTLYIHLTLHFSYLYDVFFFFFLFVFLFQKHLHHLCSSLSLSLQVIYFILLSIPLFAIYFLSKFVSFPSFTLIPSQLPLLFPNFPFVSFLISQTSYNKIYLSICNQQKMISSGVKAF